MGEQAVIRQVAGHLTAPHSFPISNDEPEAVMLRSTLAALLSMTASGAFAQTEVSPPATPAAVAEPAPPAVAAAAAQPLPRCSARVRDRCVQDERFARDVPNPNGSRDNNAMHYPTPAAAERSRPTR